MDPITKGHTHAPRPKTGPERVDKTFLTNTMQTTVDYEFEVGESEGGGVGNGATCRHTSHKAIGANILCKI